VDLLAFLHLALRRQFTVSDMKLHFESDTKPRDPLTIADTLGSSPELGTSTLRSRADPASPVTTSAQVIQPVVSLQLSLTHRYWLNHHRLIRLLMDSKPLPQCPLLLRTILRVWKTVVINCPRLIPQCSTTQDLCNRNKMPW
jgi:hypothetical protein